MTSLAYMLLVPGAFGMVVKVTIVLVVAACLVFVLRRASASTRHLVWLASLVGSLAVVVVWPIAPQYGVVSHRIPYIVIGTIAPDYADRVRVVEPIAVTRERSVGRAVRRVFSSSFDAFVAHPVPVFPATWLIGFLIVIGRCVLGHLALARLVNRARSVSSLEWRETIDDALDTVRISRGVSVLISEDIAGPVTSGALRPVVLLPGDAAMWSEERRRVVLVHEFAHIARFDYVAQLIATLVCALFWFHPLAWFAAARLQSEAEHAADDSVLIAGTSGVSYASHLLDLARVDSSPHLSAAVAVGMVRASRLEGRFRAMLDATRSRSTLSPTIQALATSLTLAAMVPFAGLRAVVDGPRLLRAPFPTPPVVVEQIVAAPDSVIERTIAAARGDRLVLALETGGNIVLRGWDEPRVRVRALLAGDDWRDTHVSLERSNREIRLTSEFSGSSSNRSTRHAFELWVPRRMNVTLSSSGGSVAINDVEGEFRGHTGGGSLVIEGASGSARLTTGGGKVQVSNSRLDGSVSTGGGEVAISNVSGNLVASSGSGPVITTGVGSGIGKGVGAGVGSATTTITGVAGGVNVGVGRGIGSTDNTTTIVRGNVGYGYASGSVTGTTIASTASAGSGVARTVITGQGGFAATPRGNAGPIRLTLSKAGGDIVMDSVEDGARLTTGGGRIYVGSSNGFLSVSTGGGDIDLPRIGGDVHASTGAGDVTITIVNANGSEHSVDVFTGHGGLVLELPATLDARFDLETAYTESKRRTSIDSDVSLTQTETNDWDDSQGTPRKYVRARGTVGNGRGLIRVRVVNGDIVVRRNR